MATHLKSYNGVILRQGRVRLTDSLLALLVRRGKQQDEPGLDDSMEQLQGRSFEKQCAVLLQPTESGGKLNPLERLSPLVPFDCTSPRYIQPLDKERPSYPGIENSDFGK